MSELTARYAAAEALVPAKFKDLVKRAQVRPQWQGDADVFRYQVIGDGGPEFYEVDCASSSKAPIDKPAQEFAMHELAAPDKSRVAFVRDHNLWVREIDSGQERQLTPDGTPERSYGTPVDVSAMGVLMDSLGLQLPPFAVWSPDSTRLVTHLLDQSALEWMHLVQASPPDGGRPKLRSYRYAMVGDPAVATAELIVLDVIDGVCVHAEGAPLLAPYASPIMFRQVSWSPDGKSVRYFHWNRSHAKVELCSMDAATGAVTVLMEERGDTHVQLSPLFATSNLHVLASGEVIWWSERSGWGHLYLVGSDGSSQPLTQGEWLVRDLVAVDEEARVAYYTAAGREPSLDPYIRQLYAVSLDTAEVRRLTDDDLDHQLSPSPSGTFAVDVASSLDVPARSVLWTLANGETFELEVADAQALYEAGWSPPERFQVLAADGSTSIYGLLYTPRDFDPSSSYAVLDDIYPGPQMNAGLMRFPASGGMTPASNAASMAALGFAVVVIDGRGTPLRSKAFQDATRRQRDLLFDDHVAAIHQLAQSRPWMDLDRVGIYGHSGGGFATARALLKHPEFYKVGVSSAGDHDDAKYHAGWGERFFGTLDEVDYARDANVALVDNLVGKLLLIHGELDDNVTPHLTMRLVDALMAADKDVDMLIVPNADHGAFQHAAHWTRRRWDYFVRHLLELDPPPYKLAPIPLDFEALAEAFG